jgi:hypothetical protein
MQDLPRNSVDVQRSGKSKTRVDTFQFRKTSPLVFELFALLWQLSPVAPLMISFLSNHHSLLFTN